MWLGFLGVCGSGAIGLLHSTTEDGHTHPGRERRVDRGWDGISRDILLRVRVPCLHCTSPSVVCPVHVAIDDLCLFSESCIVWTLCVVM